MTDEQKAHVAQLADQFEKRMAYKYAKGAEEHGGNIWELNPHELLDNAIDEAVDQVVYLLTLKESMDLYRPLDA